MNRIRRRNCLRHDFGFRATLTEPVGSFRWPRPFENRQKPANSKKTGSLTPPATLFLFIFSPAETVSAAAMQLPSAATRSSAIRLAVGCEKVERLHVDGKAARLRTPRALSSQGHLDVLGEYEFDIRYIMEIVRSLNCRTRPILERLRHEVNRFFSHNSEEMPKLDRSSV